MIKYESSTQLCDAITHGDILWLGNYPNNVMVSPEGCVYNKQHEDNMSRLNRVREEFGAENVTAASAYDPGTGQVGIPSQSGVYVKTEAFLAVLGIVDCPGL